MVFDRIARRPAAIAVIAVVCVVAAFVAGIVTGRASDDDRASASAHEVTDVFVYGDSLVRQAAPYFAVGKTFGLDVTVRADGGTAPCDFVPTLEKDLADEDVELVVWAFSGNSLLPCMQDREGQPLAGPAMLAKYRGDTESAVKAAADAHVPFVLAATPAPRDPTGWQLLDQVYREIAVAHPEIQYTDAGVGIAPGGHFSEAQQCLPFEVNAPEARPSCASPGGEVTVRSWDGGHFCAATLENRCKEYSSGARRYAINLVSAARLLLDREAHARAGGAAKS